MRISKKMLAPVVLGAVLALAGCSSGSSGSSKKSAGSEASSAAEQSQSASSDYAVTIDSARMAEDYEGNPAVVVGFTFTNNSDDDAMFSVAANVDVFQNGVELDSAVVSDTESNSFNKVKPGATIQTEEAFKLNDSSDIEVEVSELFSLSDDLLASKTFTLQ